MLRPLGWIAAVAVLLGCAAVASAQAPQPAGAGYGYPGGIAYGDPSTQWLGNTATPGVAGAELIYGPGDAGYSIPAVGDHKRCFTLYPLRTIYPYSYTGPGTGFGAYKSFPYPYVPVGYGWYGEHWRGW